MSLDQPTPPPQRRPRLGHRPRVVRVPTDVLIGRVLLERYRVTHRIARGGMGSVYLARDVADGRRVALKVLRDELVLDVGVRQRFINESRAAQRIDHPAVVRMLQVGESPDGLICLALEYVDGAPLRRLLKDGPLGQRRVVLLGAAIAEGLAAAHAQGVIHRDLKPENVLIPRRAGADSLAKIVDFGIARIVDAPRITTTQHIMGTPQYISPEQARGEDADRRADVYSLGVMLYEMLAGRLPFVADDPEELLRKHVGSPPVPISELYGQSPIAPALEELVMGCLAKAPAARPPDMGAILAVLSEL